MDNTNDPSSTGPVPGTGDQIPAGATDPTSVMPTTPPATGTPFPGAAGGAGQPPNVSQAPVADPDPDDVPNKALIAALAVVALIAIGAGLFFVFGGGDDSDTIVTDAAATTESSTTVEATTTVEETTTTIDESTTTVDETTTTVAETTTLPPTTVAPTTAAPTTVAPSTVAPTTAAPTPVVTVPPAPEATMWDVIVNSPDLSEFRAAVESAGLVDLLDGPEPITIFAPSNAAFEAFRAGVGNEAALADLPALIRHHLVAGAFSSADVFAGTSFDTLAENAIAVDDAAKTVDGARLVVVDVQAAGSVLHVTDMVLVAAV